MPFGSKSPADSLKKMAGFGLFFFRRNFNPSKCKTEAKMSIARIKLLRNKRDVLVRQMRRDVAMLLQSRQEDTARIRVEHVIREQNVLAANEIIELFCELVVARLSIIRKQKDCPADLKEGVSSLIYAAPRCSEIPELSRIRDIFEKKYGKDFVSAATDLRPESGVNRMLIEKLSVRKPSGETKLKIMKEIAKEYQVEWDTTESELELLAPAEEVLEGPKSFVSATSLPVKPNHLPQNMQPNSLRSSIDDKSSCDQFKDIASAAQAAAESAKKAVSAAQAAAFLANNYYELDEVTRYGMQARNCSESRDADEPQLPPGCPKFFAPNNPPNDLSKQASKLSNSRSSDYANHTSSAGMQPYDLGTSKIYRRHSYTAPRMHSDIEFDDSDGLDSDGENDNETDPPPARPPPVVPPATDYSEEKAHVRDLPGGKLKSVSLVHPKLPDYEALAARFEALKRRGS